MKIDERLNTLCYMCESKGRYTKTACPFRSISNDYCDRVETLQKDLEVLEIIKKKEVNIHILNFSRDADNYNSMIKAYPDEELTQNEFDLLKEWLVDE